MFANGQVCFENSSSIHSSGKKVKRTINQTREYLYSLFSVSEHDFEIVFHSGTTEFINNIVKGMSFDCLSKKEQFRFIYSLTDHACVLSQKSFLSSLDHIALGVASNHRGQFTEKINALKIKPTFNSLLNYTWVNNETGIILDLKKAVDLKEELGCIVHVDATQAVGKISNWKNLDPFLDIYTFSGHKFGALKGIGFSFVKKNLNITPMITGGGQQFFRSGTENTYGIVSLKLALEELENLKINFSKERDSLESRLLNHFDKNKFEVIGIESLRNNNTSCLLFKSINIQNIFVNLDMAGFDLSLGSACGSNLAKPSQALEAMGYSRKDATSILRVSLPFKKVDFDLAKSLNLLTNKLIEIM